MNPPADSLADLTALRAWARLESLREFDAAQLCLLALLPEWTDDTAERFGLVPAADLAGLLARLDDAGLVERRQSPGPHRGVRTVFWLRLSRRDEIGRYLRGDDVPVNVDEEIDRLARAIRTALDAPGGTARDLAAAFEPWLEVAGTHRADRSGTALFHRVDEYVMAEGGLAAATRLVAAARTVGAISGGTLAEAARRAGWRLDRAHRDAQDAEYLRDYQPRADVEEVLEELLDGERPGAPWALHLIGDGGIGKTMLLRHLSSGSFATARDLARFPVARVDFDHLDPRYPEHRPAEVLLALADELAGYGASRNWYSSYRRFRDAAGALHEQIGRLGAQAERDAAAGAAPPQPVYGSALLPAGGPTRSTVSLIRAAAAQTVRALFDEVVRAFARVLRELDRPRVVLVLDTCEELAKLYPPGAAAPAIDRTFDLLERLHDELPDVRVVLAGRRPLVPPADEQARAAGPRLRQRDYLRVVRVTGFTAAEANRFLDAAGAASTGPRPAGALRAALLHRARTPSSGADGERYNPFELAAYRDWIVREPDLDPRVLRAAGDPLVERRIIHRLADDDTRGALAVAAELGRFDLAMVTPALERAGLAARAAFDGLASQEWTQVRALGPDGRPSLLEVDEHLRDRIRAVVAAEPDRYPLDRAGLGRDAAALVRTGALGDVTPEAVETAVRLQPADQAAVFWVDLEERIAAAGEWAWAAQVATRCAGVERPRADAAEAADGLARPTSAATTIMAAILATGAAAHIHTGEQALAGPLWQAVLHHVPHHPLPDQRATLASRALLGELAAGGAPNPLLAGSPPDVDRALRLLTSRTSPGTADLIDAEPTDLDLDELDGSDPRWGEPNWDEWVAGGPVMARRRPSRQAAAHPLAVVTAFAGRPDLVPAGSALAALQAVAEGPLTGRDGREANAPGETEAPGQTITDRLRDADPVVRLAAEVFTAQLALRAAVDPPSGRPLYGSLPIVPLADEGGPAASRRGQEAGANPAEEAPGSGRPGEVFTTGSPTVLIARLAAAIAAARRAARVAGATSAGSTSSGSTSAVAAATASVRPAGAVDWADWAVPPGLVDRAELAVLRLRAQHDPVSPPPDLSGAGLDEVLSRIGDVDAERRVATAVRLALDHRVLPRDVLGRFDGCLVYRPGRSPTSWLHRQVRPLAVEVADAWTALGEPSRAADILVRYREAARLAGDDPDAVEDCDLALLELCRRYRTTEFSPSIRQLARTGSPRLRAAAWLVLSLVEGQHPETPVEAGGWHAWWRCQDHRALLAGGALRHLRPPLSTEPSWPALTAEVDRLELRLLIGSTPPPASVEDLGDRLRDPELRLRLAALVDTSRATPPSQATPPGLATPPGPARPPGTADLVGAVLAGMPALVGARLAVRVAEELAPRLPREAAALLRAPDGTPRTITRLHRAGDDFAAAAADVLRVRVRQRAGLDSGAPTPDVDWRPLAYWPAWRARVAATALADWEVDTAPQPVADPARTPGELLADVIPPPPWDDTTGPTAARMSVDPPARTDRLVPAGAAARDDRVAMGTIPRAIPAGSWSAHAEPVHGHRGPESSVADAGAERPAAGRDAGGRRGKVLAAVAVAAVVRSRVAGRSGSLPRFGVVLGPGGPGAGQDGQYRLRPGHQVTVRSGRVHVADTRLAPAVFLHSRTPDGALAARLAERGRLWCARVRPGVRTLWRVDGERITGPPGRLGPRRGWERDLRVVTLDVDEADRAGDWESRLAAALPASLARTVVFARLRAGRAEPGAATPKPTPVASPGGGPRAVWPSIGESSIVEPSIGEPAAGGAYVGPRHLRPTDGAGRPVSVPGVVHAVGTPVRTGSGLRLRVSDPDAGPALAGDGALLGIEDLGVDTAGLTVLQADLIDGPATPLGDDREGFVDLAIAALDAGAPAVLVLPPLPDRSAAVVAAALRGTATSLAAPTASRGRRAGSPSAEHPGERVLPVLAARTAKEIIEVFPTGEHAFEAGGHGRRTGASSGAAVALPGVEPAVGTGRDEPTPDSRAAGDVLLFLR